MLAVGDSTELEIIFSTKKYRNKIAKRPRIRTNEGPPDKHVQIISHVVPRPDSTYPLVVSPYKLNLSQFGDKVRKDIEFRIENVSDQELNVELIASANRYFELDLPGSIKPGESSEATLTLTDKGMKDEFEKSFTLEVDDAETSRFTIPVMRSIRTMPGQSTTTQASGGSGK